MTYSKLRFSKVKNFVSRSGFGSSNSRRYHCILKLLVATYKSEVWEQKCVAFSLFSFWQELCYKVKESIFLLNENIKFNKNEAESKTENPNWVLEKWSLYFSSRSSRPEVFCKKGVLRNFTKFTEKHLCQSLFFNKDAGCRCFPVNFAKFLRTSFFIEQIWRLLLSARIRIAN